MMSDPRSLLERESRRFIQQDGAFERLVRRRDRKRRNQRIAAGVVGIAVFVAAAVLLGTVGLSDSTRGPAGGAETGPAETGPAVTPPKETVPPPLVEAVTIGTVTRSGAGCTLQSLTEPIFQGAGRLSLVNETNRWVSFELYRFDPEVLTFAEFEAIVAEGGYWGPHPQAPPGTFVQIKREVGPGASGTITDNFTTGAFAVVCLDQHQLLETVYDYLPFAVVGPIVVSGPAPTQTVAPDAGWDGLGIPPEGTVLSAPVDGQPLRRDSDYNHYLVVYADGRVLWWNALRMGGGDYVLERRLTPESVDLVRSGAIRAEDLAGPSVLAGVPASAWADAEARPYAPARYSVCFVISRPDDEEIPSATDLARAMDLLPASAKALLRGTDPDPLHPGCVVASTQEARAFSGIMFGEGLETGVNGVAAEGTLGVTPGSWVGGWLLRGAKRILGEPLGVNLRLLWPDGEWHDQYKA